MVLRRVEIVGAGLAGLTAAINLAGEGREVVVYEKEKKIGGMPSARPDPAGGPFDVPRLKGTIGIDISPALTWVERSFLMIWGRKVEMKPRPGLPMYMVERGSRKTSLDSLLYRTAKERGVKVEFGQAFETRKDFEDLPPGSIIATGLEHRAFHTLGIPHNTGYAIVAKGKVDHQTATATIYMNDYTVNYGFTSTVNGLCYAHLFQADKPIRDGDLEGFDRDVRQAESYKLSPWKEVDIGALPYRSYSNPRLFWGDKVLAGTLAGAIDPLYGFGMLGALLSGKIAATAQSDRDAAVKEFRRLNVLYAPELLGRKLMTLPPAFLRRGMAEASAAVFDLLPDSVVDFWYRFVPGYGRMG
jgi:flavin-dependent dehydrogenase